MLLHGRLSAICAALFVGVARVAGETIGFDVISLPSENEKIQAGSTYQIVWQPSPNRPGNVSISLLNLDGGGAQVIENSVDSADGKFNWQLEDKLGATYNVEQTFRIRLALNSDPSIFQTSAGFHIVKSRSNDVPATGTLTGPSPTASIARITSAPQNPDPPPQPSFDPATIAGVIIGCATGVAIIAALIFFGLRYRRKALRKRLPGDADDDFKLYQMSGTTSELDGFGKRSETTIASHSTPQELDSRSDPVELEAPEMSSIRRSDSRARDSPLSDDCSLQTMSAFSPDQIYPSPVVPSPMSPTPPSRRF